MVFYCCNILLHSSAAFLGYFIYLQILLFFSFCHNMVTKCVYFIGTATNYHNIGLLEFPVVLGKKTGSKRNIYEDGMQLEKRERERERYKKEDLA